MTSPAVRRWLGLLASQVGIPQEEISALHGELADFCARHRASPDTVLANWTDYPELTVRRRHDLSTPPNLAVESFLIHNGVNVFGDIVCVAGRPEDLATQGARFVPASAPAPGSADDRPR